MEAEIIKNQYRLIYAADRTLNDNDTRIIPRSKLYYTYEEAFVQAEGVITDRLNELESLHRADVVNDICELPSPCQDESEAEPYHQNSEGRNRKGIPYYGAGN